MMPERNRDTVPKVLELLREAVTQDRVQWHQHTLIRCLQRNIDQPQVLHALLQGEIIESYPNDRPFPSHLILHLAEEPLHVVAALDEDAMVAHIITVYRPDRLHFMEDWKTRCKTK